MTYISRGFRGRRQQPVDASRLPPGQYLVDGFPVLSAGPTPHTPLSDWSFTIDGEVDNERRWSWEEFRQLPAETITKDIHCVTKWSKFDTSWTGVSIATLLQGVGTSADYVLAYSDGDYTTNLPLEDVIDGKAWVAFEYDGQPLEPEHGGPARLLVPDLYFWKSVAATAIGRVRGGGGDCRFGHVNRLLGICHIPARWLLRARMMTVKS